jgi:hypothetical protein
MTAETKPTETKTLDFNNRNLVVAVVKACVIEGARNYVELAEMLTMIGFRTQNGTPISDAVIHIKLRRYGIDPEFPKPEWSECDRMIRRWHREGRKTPEIIRMLNDRVKRPDAEGVWNERVVRQRLTAMGLRRCPMCQQLNVALADEELPKLPERRPHRGKRTRAERERDINEVCALVDGLTAQGVIARGRSADEDDGDGQPASRTSSTRELWRTATSRTT